jgi:hypothetical protein
MVIEENALMRDGVQEFKLIEGKRLIHLSHLLLACKIELPGGGEMARALACERATSASLCAPDKGCRFPRF